MLEYQRVVAEIDLDAIAYNMRNIKKITKDGIEIMGVVKADAYGHGAVEVAKVILYNGATRLGVAMVDEGIQLRKNNICVPILILGYTPEAKLDDVVKYDITQTIFTYEMALQLSNIAVKYGKIAKVHIKIDTGMGRIGFVATKNPADEIEKISKLPNLDLEGIYTHFATSDEADKSFTILQKQRFIDTIKSLEEKDIKFKVIHAANSAGIMDFEDMDFTMERAGIVLYGMYPSDNVKKERLALKPAMSIKTHISFVKHVSEGESISYGRTFVTKTDSVIATVPVGYADGYLRAMQRGGRVIVNGEYAPVVGRVCMDQFMIDVTGIPNVRQGDTVIIMGHDGDKCVSAEEMANVMDTINYEVVCTIGKRVPREYFKNNTMLKTVHYV